jgi:cation diffusion facilitator CzcD-associated flavoprotein CzcO
VAINDGTVAIIGAGPAGLAAAKFLSAQGFKCVVFEQSDDIGGQWNARGAQSGVWPEMRTNTSRVMTCFSDLRHEPGTATYPTNREIFEYLHRYAEKFKLLDSVRLGTRVDSLEKHGDGYLVRSLTQGSRPAIETFSNVVLASGRYNRPSVPSIPGLESFTGSGGVVHSFNYKEPARYRGLRVLVAGCAISALEIASDLAMLGAAKVVTSYRRQRYVVQKLLAGVPTDHLAFTRHAALAAEAFPPEAVSNSLRDFIVRSFGSPEQFGAPQPSPSIVEAKITLSQHYLPLVAEGRIVVKPWIESIDGQRVHFADGSEEEFDAIIFGTGYSLSLPYLQSGLQKALNVGARNLDLYNFTFNPDLEGLAVSGLHFQIGPYFPVAELQGRWIAYVWSRIAPRPSQEAMREGIARARRMPLEIPMHISATSIARAAGVDPVPDEFPQLKRALLFGPMSAMSFRLSGPDALPEAQKLFAEDAAAFGAFTSPELTPEQTAQLNALDQWKLKQKAA